MRVWLTLLVGFLAIVAVYFAISMVIGLVWWLGVAGFVLLCVVGVVRSLVPDSDSRPVGRRQERKLDRQAERALRDIERKMPPQ